MSDTGYKANHSCSCVAQTCLYTLVGWYLDQVFPSKYGVRQPPWFVFRESYWR